MKSIPLLTSLIFFLAASLPGKAQDSCMKFSWVSAFTANTIKPVMGYNISATIDTDTEGNIYMTGTFSDTIIMGRDTLYGPVSPAQIHSFVARLDAQGQCIWAVEISGADEVVSCAIKVGDTGEIYIAGSFNQTAVFGSDTLSSVRTHYHDLFLSTLSADGDFISTVTNNISTSSSYSIEQHIRSGHTPLVIDGTGNLHLSGWLDGTASFDGITLTGPTGQDYMVFAKLNRSGEWVWAITPQFAHARRTAITTDGAGNVYIFGDNNSDAIFGNDTLTGRQGFCLARISPDGQWQWAKTVGTASVNANASAGTVMVSPATGNIFVAGAFAAGYPAVFGDDTLTAAGLAGYFLACTNAQGQLLWAHQSRGYHSLAIAPGNGCYAASGDAVYHISETGTIIDSLFVDTNAIKSAMIAFPGNFQHPRLVADAGGHVYITGLITGDTAVFGDITVEATAPGSAFFVAEISCDPPATVRDDRESHVSFSVYPNPTTGMLTLDFDRPDVDAVIEIYDIHGRPSAASRHSSGQQRAEIQLDSSPGIYLLQVTTEAGRETKKIIRL